MSTRLARSEDSLADLGEQLSRKDLNNKIGGLTDCLDGEDMRWSSRISHRCSVSPSVRSTSLLLRSASRVLRLAERSASIQ
jgi:hypothetical protein